jgi:alkylation response protein AidB-like acyl-CoA dehydrogenase
MHFDLTREQKDIQQAAREFAEGEFDKDLAIKHDKEHAFPRPVWKKACQLGFLGIHFPEELGGQGLGVLENALVIEEFCRRDSGIGVALSLADFASDIVLRHGTDAQKRAWLPAIASGKAISAGCFTEPNHGSDITAMDTAAVKDGDAWVINGTKTFITNGSIADVYIVLCQTDAAAQPPHRGQSLLLVPKGTPGLEAAEVGEKLGIRMTSTAEVSFSGVRVPAENLVGEENKGFYHVLEFFSESRIEVAASAVGMAQGAFDRALEYAKQRKQFGQRLADFQVTQHKLADMATQIEAARLLTYKAAWLVDQGKPDPKATSMAKLHAGRTAVYVTDEAVQILGGYGYILENEVERFFRDAKITEIYEGTKEIQKNVIAGTLIKKK